jgi:hypothetical protein
MPKKPAAVQSRPRIFKTKNSLLYEMWQIEERLKHLAEGNWNLEYMKAECASLQERTHVVSADMELLTELP